MGDVNCELDNQHCSYFMQCNSLDSILHAKTCWKSPMGKSIDLILTNKKASFKHTGVFETGVSDFHNLIFTVLRAT